MAEVLLFHHGHGRTSGVSGFADRLRDAGHTVHVPDLYDGRVFPSLEEGVGYAQEIGFDTFVERGVAAAGGLPAEIVYAGFSLGVLPAQKLAQTRRGAQGALLFEACAPVTEFSDGWPRDVPVQVHGMTEDPFFAGEGDVDTARALTAAARRGELFQYPGSVHLFADPSLPTYQAAPAALLTERVLAFLGGLANSSPTEG